MYQRPKEGRSSLQRGGTKKGTRGVTPVIELVPFLCTAPVFDPKHQMPSSFTHLVVGVAPARKQRRNLEATGEQRS